MSGHKSQSSLTKDVPSAPPKKKAKKDIACITANWESCPKPVSSMATSTNDTDNESMVKQGGITSNGEGDNMERKAIANDQCAQERW